MSVAHRSQTHLTPTRANFMILVFTAVFGFIGLGYIGAILGYLIPRKGEGSRPQNLGSVSKLPFVAGVAGPFTYDATGRGDVQGVFAVQTGSTGGTVRLVLEQTCTHLGCPVAWTPPATPSTAPVTARSSTKSGSEALAQPRSRSTSTISTSRMAICGLREDSRRECAADQWGEMNLRSCPVERRAAF